jgi:hypothetical protein
MMSEGNSSSINLDLGNTARKMEELNAHLNEKGLELELIEITDELDMSELTHYEDLDTKHHLLLCLNQRESSQKCISSIICKITESNTIEISSKTRPEFEGRGYNKLLRSAIIFLAPYIIHNGTRIEKIVSRAINPASTYIMIKYFHAHNGEFDSYRRREGKKYENITPEDIRIFEEEKDEKIMREIGEKIGEDLDEEEYEEKLNEYMMENESIGEPYYLTVDVSDRTGEIKMRMQQMAKKVFFDTLTGSKKKGGTKKKRKTRMRSSTQRRRSIQRRKSRTSKKTKL